MVTGRQGWEWHNRENFVIIKYCFLAVQLPLSDVCSWKWPLLCSLSNLNTLIASPNRSVWNCFFVQLWLNSLGRIDVCSYFLQKKKKMTEVSRSATALYSDTWMYHILPTHFSVLMQGHFCHEKLNHRHRVFAPRIYPWCTRWEIFFWVFPLVG